MPSTVAADDLDGRANLYWTRSYCGHDDRDADHILTFPAPRTAPITPEYMAMNTLTTNRRHFVASQLYALAADARRSALENGADREIAALHANQARQMRERAAAARNGARSY